MKFRNLFILLVSVLMPFAASAAVDSEGSKATQNFIKSAAASNAFEVQSSQLALDKSQDPEVKRFAQEMIEDHRKTAEQLKSAVATSGLDSSLITTTLDSKHQNIVDSLNKTSGSEFDRDYWNAQVKAHQESVKLFKHYAKHGDNATLKNFAGQTLSSLEKHQDHLKQMNK